MAPTIRESTRPEAITFDSIAESLVNERTPGVTNKEMQNRRDAHCEAFLPNTVLESFVQEGNVKATLDELLGADNYDQSLIGYIVKDAPKAFLTVIYMDVDADSKLILKPLQQKGFTDSHLPVETHMRRPGRYDVRQIGSGQKLEYFSDWRAKLCENYESEQWPFLAPTFRERDFSYVFHENERPPFVYIPNPTPDGGHFGQVLKLGLRLDHLHFDQRNLAKFQLKRNAKENYVEVAVKFMSIENNTTKSDVEKFYPRERDTLERMRDLNDPHLIRAIAAYERGKSRCFIFPWAEGGNLATFWRNDTSHLGIDLIRWALDQMTGIAGGIKKLHAENIRHGDIKPFNILYFPDTGKKLRRGTLKIADVGLAKVHTEYTRYRIATTTRMSSERYEPPEMESYLHQILPIPRVYDSWSLGCVFLEFTIWLIYGRSKLDDFHKDLKNSLSNKFYETKGDSRPRHNAVNSLIEKMEKKLPKTTALGRLVRLISERLLVPAEKRMSTKTLHKRLESISKRCECGTSYYFGPALVSLARDRPVPGNGPDNHPQPPDSHTSNIDNKWRNIPDSEWARFLISHLDFSSLRPTMETDFCDRCNTIELLADGHDLGRSLQDLEQGSGDCSMCRFLHRCFSKVSTKTVDQGQRHLSLSGKGAPAISFYVDPDYKGPTPRQARLGLPVLPSPGSPQEFALLNDWVTLCDRTHDCISSISEDEWIRQMPTRLIYVGTKDTTSLRLIETKQENITESYIALSHCWGKLSKEERFCTYIDNIQDLKKHIPFDKLPQTFKDAVTATRALKVQYLWIDSLCIIQEDPEDWKIEAAKMEDVFNSAYCTIAASSSTSSLDGFLGNRKDRAVIGIRTANGPLYLSEAIDDFHEDVEQGILNTRGWVFQERALSRRTIHFTSTQVYWECGHGVHCETLAHLRNRESELLGDSDFPSYGLQKYMDDSIRLVQHLYKAYSRLNLTNLADRSKAMLGLEKRLGRTFQSRAECGILSIYFERLLLWQRDQNLPLDEISYANDQEVPTWSWMSLMGRISYLEGAFGKVNWTGNVKNPFSSEDGVSSDRRLRAKAHELSIGENALKCRIRTDITHSKMDPKDFKCVVAGTSKLANEDGTTDQYVLLIRQKSPGVYRRIGVGTLLDIHIRPQTEKVYIV
ncbi:uncharacterized protein B0J16DRAFT_388043 [Fusarium flagelliforme]|uniref:uncharacterized protein n=1 Tax=Fusarium flagelliforme TaxID=2675880 RepID=UPI001E8E4CDD|nr:uncharacterized protein B0J16DRAFT_388043 [Fusarium flagelliforme]KAH7174219.1 hypothetical protein B0J16DRAFT_388043 [Fusarium flagelliforme]